MREYAIGLLTAVGVRCRKTAALVTGALLHLLILCQLGPAISIAPIGSTTQAVWGWTLALTNLGLALHLLSLVVAPSVPEDPS